MKLRRRVKNGLRLLRVPFEWIGIGLGVLVLSNLSHRGMLGLCDFLPR